MLARIVAGAAHDIRSPLTALKGFTSTLLSRWERLDEEQRHAMLEGIAGDAARMELVVAQLVDAARLRSGVLELAPVPTDLLTAARDAAEDMRSWNRGDLLVGGETVRASVDPRRLRTMLAAMVETAQWFAEEGPVGIEVRDAGGPMVSVWRRKPTVAGAEVDGLFVPRAPGSGGGSKVGLFVARWLAEAHGGTLTAVVDERLTLTLRFPGAAS
jgi:signal transduction histidine kinase